MKVKLGEIAHARSGDKGAASNVGIRADRPEVYEWLREVLTPECVAQHFSQICRGPVERFELPNLQAFNFLLHDSLRGGGTSSLLTDAQGKAHGQALLEMELELPEALAERLGSQVAEAKDTSVSGVEEKA